MFRSVICYAAPIWFSINSNLMEKLRVFERKCLRKSTGLIYKREENKYYRNIDVYNKAKLIRIDNFIVNLCKNFIENAKRLENGLVKEIINNTNFSLNDNFYNIKHLKKLSESKMFHNEKKEITYYNGRHSSVQFVK